MIKDDSQTIEAVGTKIRNGHSKRPCAMGKFRMNPSVAIKG